MLPSYDGDVVTHPLFPFSPMAGHTPWGSHEDARMCDSKNMRPRRRSCAASLRVRLRRPSCLLPQLPHPDFVLPFFLHQLFCGVLCVSTASPHPILQLVLEVRAGLVSCHDLVVVRFTAVGVFLGGVAPAGGSLRMARSWLLNGWPVTPSMTAATRFTCRPLRACGPSRCSP